jgi:hypothetical protein
MLGRVRRDSIPPGAAGTLAREPLEAVVAEARKLSRLDGRAPLTPPDAVRERSIRVFPEVKVSRSATLFCT